MWPIMMSMPNRPLFACLRTGGRQIRLAAGILFLLVPACNQFDGTRLGAVKRAGEIVVLTRNSPVTFYEGPDGPTGFEYDLAQAFADHLGVNLKIVLADRFAEILPQVAQGKADFGAAGITVTPGREEMVRFARPYQTIRQQVIYHIRTLPPSDPSELVGRHIEVAEGTSYVERLEQLRERYPKLSWVTTTDMETEVILTHVQEGLTDLTIADSNIASLVRQFNPELRVAFALGDPEQLAWAFPKDTDDTLFLEASRFIEKMEKSGDLAHLIERYYGAASRFNPINIAAYLQKIDDELPRFRELFEEAARRHVVDWRLLAAMSYQESYWNPAAVSPTGVRGIMMLTESTARNLGIRDRLDARQSIFGGATYLRSLVDRLPERIPEPDRTWMALAAYNVGFYHLEDARIITESQGGDPDKWSDVKDRLPLLASSVWYTKTKHGYARGYEPVQFVTRIRTYYEILRKQDDSRSRIQNEVLRLRMPAL